MCQRWRHPIGILCAALALAACGGETGISKRKPEPEPTTTPEPTLPPPPLAGVIIINEVMPGNQSTVNGPDGSSMPDYIELLNVGGSPVDLVELGLRNADGVVWRGTEGESIDPGEYFIVWASEEDVGSGPNTGFSLDKEGDKLTLLDSEDRVLDFIEIEDVPTDVSWSRTPDATGELVATAWPTPQAANGEAASPTLNPADETVFLPYVMHRIDFEFTPEAYNFISNPNRPEVHVGLTIDGVHYDDIGLKLKGSASYQDMSGKPAFIVDLNEWVEGTKFRDLKAFKLHNGLVLDPTRNRDFLSYGLAREAGLLAPRVGWAEVYCNDVYYGLYIFMEKHDDVFMEYRLPDQEPLGYIFEPNESEGSGWGWGDFGNGSVSDWNIEEGEIPVDQAVIDAMTAADNLIGGSATDERVEALWSYFDKEAFLTYLAWETMIMHTDGYKAPNNWRVFVDGVTHDIQLVPSGAEWTWDADVDAWYYGGAAGAWCLDNTGCSREFAEHLLVMADLVETMDLYGQFSDLQAWLDPYIDSDPRYSTAWQSIQDARSSTGRHLSENPNAARQQVYSRFPDLAP